MVALQVCSTVGAIMPAVWQRFWCLMEAMVAVLRSSPRVDLNNLLPHFPSKIAPDIRECFRRFSLWEQLSKWGDRHLRESGSLPTNANAHLVDNYIAVYTALATFLAWPFAVQMVLTCIGRWASFLNVLWPGARVGREPPSKGERKGS